MLVLCNETLYKVRNVMMKNIFRKDVKFLVAFSVHYSIAVGEDIPFIKCCEATVQGGPYTGSDGGGRAGFWPAALKPLSKAVLTAQKAIDTRIAS
jgi:hypothetical protein